MGKIQAICCECRFFTGHINTKSVTACTIPLFPPIRNFEDFMRLQRRRAEDPTHTCLGYRWRQQVHSPPNTVCVRSYTMEDCIIMKRECIGISWNVT